MSHSKRDPSSHRTPEQIRAMDHGYEHTPEMRHKRVLNNQARAIMVKEGRAHKGDGKDVDHIDGLRNDPRHPNRKGNLRVVSASRNRGWADGKV